MPLLEVRDLSVRFGGVVALDHVSFSVEPGAVVAVIGPNGAGKTTLFRMITGHEKPDAGTLEVGPSVKMGVVDQTRETLDDKRTVYEEITGGQDEIAFGKEKINGRSYVFRFGFRTG